MRKRRRKPEAGDNKRWIAREDRTIYIAALIVCIMIIVAMFYMKYR